MSQIYISPKDFYEINDVPLGSGATAYIDSKFKVVTAHITNATSKSLNPDQLYISFASAAFIDDTPAMTPQVRLSLFYIWMELDLF